MMRLAYAALALSVAACSSASSPAGSDAAVPEDAGSVDATLALDAAHVDAALPLDAPPTLDAPAPLDAGDGGTTTDPFAWRLGNLAGAPQLIDICVSSTQGQFTTPILKSLGLPAVPPRAVSAPFTPPPADPIHGDRWYRVIDASPGAPGDCGGADGAAALVDGASNLGGGRLMLYTNGQRTSFFSDSPTCLGVADAGIDIVDFHGSDQNGFFILPDGGAMGLGIDSCGAIAGGVTGSILTTGFPDASATLPFKTLSGGVVHILSYGSTIVPCDFLLPPENGLTVCNASVRAP